ncbi:hypothetical protein [Bacillus thuringiensis]|uniref:hypothetical protein n=1 Tax=Bacillus thuringiensis TaxID=1428 RepID=UPI000BFE06AD|nr:hypothetical protein [Bacillus thuringiensis]PGT89830.1 hypothetical protein COD17_08765 [Bacillus thuringiensis]
MDKLQVTQHEIDCYENGGKAKVLRFGTPTRNTEFHFPVFPLDKLAELVKGNAEEEALCKTWSDYQLEVEQFLLLTHTLVNSANAYITYSNLINEHEQPDMFSVKQMMKDARTLEMRLQSLEPIMVKAYTVCVNYFPLQAKYDPLKG